MTKLISILVLVFAAVDGAFARPPGAGKSVKTETYDYIIVGGGTAGGTVATRLSQGLPDKNILLIEAGPSALEEAKINVPGLKASTIAGPLDWNFSSVAQPGTNGRSWFLPRGKVLGGSSALNFMLWNRGSRPEFDAWESLGNPGWNWESIRENMMKSETFTNLNPAEASVDGRGTSGPIQTVVSRYITAQQDLWRSALIKLGIASNIDSMDGQPLGVEYHPSSIDPVNWTRSYSANAYIPQAGTNLKVMTNTRVARVNLNTLSDDVTACGVTLEDGTVITATKEVILSAGAYQSPGLLELSGIGQKSVLDAAGIRQTVDLPGVGENLQDHTMYSLVYQLKDNYTAFDKLTYNATFAAEQMELWNQKKLSIYDSGIDGVSLLNWKQMLTDDSTLQALAEEELGNSTNVVERTKLDFVQNDAVAKSEIVFVDGYLGAKGYPAEGTPLYGKGYLSIISAAFHPTARGTVHITSSNIADAPAIDPRYFQNEYDIQSQIEAAKYVRKIASTEPLASAIVTEYEPGTEVSTDEQWRKFVLDASTTVFHPSSTCAMLPRADGGVVDSRLKVYGTTNLRVVDASIMPILIASHPQTAIYSIAEKAATLIIEDA